MYKFITLLFLSNLLFGGDERARIVGYGDPSYRLLLSRVNRIYFNDGPNVSGLCFARPHNTNSCNNLLDVLNQIKNLYETHGPFVINHITITKKACVLRLRTREK